MAIRKKSNDDSRSSGKSGNRRSSDNWGKRFFRKILLVLVFLLGGLIFNLDRAGDFGITLLRMKNVIPPPFSKWLPGASAKTGAPVPEQVLEGRVIEVKDGDTIVVFNESANVKYTVRFFGIDAPEKAMHFGSKSTGALQKKILGENVSVRVVNTDMYGRAVGRVMLGTRYINLEMVADGWAWFYPDYAAHEYDLAAAEKEARLSRRGLWQEQNPTPPWEYRKRKK